MKKLLLILICLFVSVGSLNGQTHKWTKFHEYDMGNVLYIDVENIKEKNGFIYWYYLEDHLEPWDDNTMSSMTYRKGDCKTMKSKRLTWYYFYGRMGTKFNYSELVTGPFSDWFDTYPEEVG